MDQLSHPVQLSSERIRVRGLVQGVGFRPTVYRIASELQLKGEVLNDGEGVLILLQAAPGRVKQFIQNLQQQCPPLARIESIEQTTQSTKNTYTDFTIKLSQSTEIHTGIVPDAATCPECLADINNEQNRRANYAFTNCTHCGPRLSIINNIPYDRSTTSMASFKLCPSCQQEYDSSSDRRFHAQPNACPDCGPSLTLRDNQRNQIPCEDEISATIDLIEQGYIIAIKGIGGFQLACDASNEKSVVNLRSRKNRPHKPLALMAANINQIKRNCSVTTKEQEILQSPAAPIVLLDKLSTNNLPDAIAPGQSTLGFMLPNSPLHHLLLQSLKHPVVLTSGNVSEEPQCIDNENALNKLGVIADYFLLHDRDIINRVDDSVIRSMNGRMQHYRRARGYTPAPITLTDGLNSEFNILACGGELKNTFCLLKDGQAILSQHMGNLENVQTYDDYLINLDLYTRLYQFESEAIVVDQHPEYLSSKYGRELASTLNKPLIEVQHHHAHLAACLVDNQWSTTQGQVIGVVLDGLGFGNDGTLWGGEFVLVDYHDFKRLGRFKLTAMPGATQCILQPWRNTYAQLLTHTNWQQLTRDYSKLELIQYLSDKPLETLQRMIDSNTNAPFTSSCGRLFDAVAAAVGIQRDQISYEGQAAIELEALVNPTLLDNEVAYPFQLENNELIEINPRLMWLQLLNDLSAGISAARISARFHKGLAEIICTTVSKIQKSSGINTVALSGGVFQNKTLLQLTTKLLQQYNIEVLLHQQFPANDGGLAIGQVAIAAARLNRGVN